MRRVNWAQLRIIHSFYVVILNEGIHNAHDTAQNDCAKFQEYWSAFPWAIANKGNILILWDAPVYMGITRIEIRNLYYKRIVSYQNINYVITAFSNFW